MPLFRETRVLTLEGAKRIAAAAEAEALRHHWTVAIALVDPSGGLILFHSVDGTQAGSEEIAIAKARTSARLKRPTKSLEDGIAGGRHALLTVPGALSLEGGVPIIVQGHLLGAIGVSGMNSTEDGRVAAAALASLD
jgi:uncharacterized protein GlcG (DUF336 family)